MKEMKEVIIDSDSDFSPTDVRNQVETAFVVPVLKPSRHLTLTPEDVHEAIAKYVNICIKLQCPITASGMANYLGTNRKTLIEIATGQSDKSYDEEVIELIKSGLSLCEQYAEEKLYSKVSSGAIFALKNISHTNWKDRQEITNKDETEIDDAAIDELVNLLQNQQKLDEIHSSTDKLGNGEDTESVGQEV